MSFGGALRVVTLITVSLTARVGPSVRLPELPATRFPSAPAAASLGPAVQPFAGSRKPDDQVLQEFFVTTTRKIPKPLDTPAAARIIDDLAHWHVHAPAAGDALAAIDIRQRTGASFWDAMILRSAKELGCGSLHSDDLNPGQAYDGVQVRNPFLA